MSLCIPETLDESKRFTIDEMECSYRHGLVSEQLVKDYLDWGNNLPHAISLFVLRDGYIRQDFEAERKRCPNV